MLASGCRTTMLPFAEMSGVGEGDGDAVGLGVADPIGDEVVLVPDGVAVFTTIPRSTPQAPVATRIATARTSLTDA